MGVIIFVISNSSKFLTDKKLIGTETEQKKAEFRDIASSLSKSKVNSKMISVEAFRSYYDIYGPNVMLDVLNENTSCHSQAHNLGRVIYEHSQDLAASVLICQNKCSEGCIHGVFMGMFETEKNNLDTHKEGDDHVTTKDLSPMLQSKITHTCEKSEITRFMGVGNCYHAIGHAVASLANYDIPAALDLCNLFNDYGIGAIYYCATGVYMERDVTLGKHDADMKGEPLYPCDTSVYPAACYRYKLRRIFSLPREYKKAEDICLGLTGSQRKGCFHGLGFGSQKLVYDDPKSLNVLCGGGDTEDKRMCIEGVFGLINVYDKKRSLRACSFYTAGEKAVCFEASTIANFGMERDFERYMR